MTALTIGGALTGCSGREIPQHDTEDSASSGSTTTISPTTTVSSTTASSTTVAPTTTLGTDDAATLDSGDDISDESSYDDGWDTCGGFYGGCPPDGGHTSFECDIWAQDCPPDEKCVAWADDGGTAWNATRCAPLDVRPHQPGEPCTVEGSGVSGVDDCELGSMCWNVDPDTNQGVCVGLCEGSEANPVCEDPATECAILNDGVLILCLRPCDPLLSGCGPGEGCYPEPDGSAFFCLPDASGAAGAHGDACNAPETCDSGLFCADADTVAGCVDDSCCTELCDLTAELPDAACSGAQDGETCVAWFAEGEAPARLAHLGVCVLPEA